MKKTLNSTFTFLLVIITSISYSQNNDIEINSKIDTISYCLGLSFGRSMKSEGIDKINIVFFAKAITDIFNNEKLLFEPLRADQILSEYIMNLRREKAEINLKAGQEFLENNKNKEGVITLPSGLQYKVLRKGTGLSPKLTDKVTVHYHGTLIDETVFDSSFERGNPIQFSVNGVINGWTEALQLMKVGAKWKLFIPANLAYGENVPKGSKIEPNMVLIFEVELLSIE